MRLRRILPILLALAAACLLALSAAGAPSPPVALTPGEQSWLAAHPVIRLAPDPDFMPIEYVDRDGTYRGAAADIVSLLQEKLGVRIAIVRPRNWDDAMGMFRERRVDLLGAIVRTPSREKFVLFTDTLLAVPGGIFVRDTGTGSLTLDDLKGKKVAVVSNYAAHDVLRSRYPGIVLDVVPDVSTGLAKASLGMVDAYVENMASATYYLRETGITNLRLAGRTDFEYRWAVGVRKDWPQLRDILDKGLAAVGNDERKAVLDRWIGIRGATWRPDRAFVFGAVASILALLLAISWAWNRSLRKAKGVALESERRFKALFRNLPDPVYIADADGRILAANAAACRETGYAPEELLRMKVTDIDTFPAQGEGEAHFRKVFGQGEETFEVVHRRRDGSLFPAEINTRRIEYDGRPAILGVARNIAARRQAEDALRESEGNLSRAQEMARLGSWSFDPGTGRLSWSREMYRIFGVSFGEFVPGVEAFLGLIHPDDRDAMREWIRACMAGEKPGELEFRAVHPDGSVRIVSGRGELSVEGGEPRMAGTAQDVTERKRMEEAVRETGLHLETAVQAAHVGLWDWDLVTGRVYFSPEWKRQIGYEEREIADDFAEWERRVHPEDLERSLRTIRSFVEKPWPAYNLEFRFRHKDGSWRWILSQASILRDPQGKPVRMMGSHVDITERKRAEEEKERLHEALQQAMTMEAVGRLAGGVAHDFNNLLTAILGNVALAQRKIVPSDPAHGLLSEATRAAERAAGLTQQLLAFSRKQVIEPKVLDLNELIGNVQTMLIRLIGENIALETVPGEGLGPVKVDPGQFERILVNLAVNARDAMPDGGTLRIETSNEELDEEFCARHPEVRPGRYVAVTVRDTGLGMSEEVRAHVFEPFFTTKPKGAGTGLGLATIYGLVRQAEGTIEVESAVGKGTAFRIHLPRVEGEAAFPAEPGLPDEMPPGSETVFFVEDEEMVRELGVRILERLGYRVTQASSGEEAIALAAAFGERIDLLVTDVVMPGMHGRELADRLALLHPEARVLFTSGYTDDAIVSRGVMGEGVSFIGKPYSPSEFAKKVREVLDGR